MSQQPISLGRAIRERRTALGLSLAALAARVGCSKGYLSTIENEVRSSPPSDDVLRRIEQAMGMGDGELVRIANWHKTPPGIKHELGQLMSQMQTRNAAVRRLAELLRPKPTEISGDAENTNTVGPQPAASQSGSADQGDTSHKSKLDEAFESGELRRLLDLVAPDHAEKIHDSLQNAMTPVPIALPLEVPLINKVSAGYPTEFTDLGYPARIADEYVRVTDIGDPDAFACRVVGDSMEPEYRQGDIVVFSPMAMIVNGTDCFARLEPDHESTFKRVYFETDANGNQMIRLQPLNNIYPPRILPREMVAGLYAAVSVTRKLS
ncbi:MAG: helix-turn-helix domain-containing protein [Phycisphaeraceae bacterium]|nr:helix-turn-helix domain-containing protein [Phycisphaerales bacterium]MCB9859367.1 helix-turn-helix domain-containing protein [Phycisphaeraceae bacterium]